jgi:uncharacterized protein (TIGR02453 family)
MSGQAPVFTKELFQFLVELKFNNERPWFLAHKARYEASVKRPLEAFCDAFLPRLKRIAPAYDRARMFRIHRDTRFSRDKTPYKTQAAAQFLHRAAGGDVHSPAFYLHLEPGESFLGAGIWAPEPETLARIRARIVARPAQWAPLSKLELWGESYARPPKGVDPDHRFVADLKRKHFLTWIEFTDRQVLEPAFIERLARACRKSVPLVAFLDAALGLD